ncbi:MarR family transcriptional regulator [Kineosporia sp. J2-2]|uniref:MarR family transcriptional regulator n=1 Tax=Kineosporia corallincola TaxID=2835133 RepID=A0ABS5TSU5_9ACTN|nr:MarR family transcriptional regulator [Kineosporia corallincola]MBT0773883.1 MarR family transcriptional regulator [Kineosporia corallincola]
MTDRHDGPGTAGLEIGYEGPERGGPPWLDRSAADAWLNLVAVMELLPVALDAQLVRDSDLSFAEFLCLAQLAEADGHALRLTDLAATTNLGLPRISRVAARLEKDGFVQRRVHEKDGRSRQVRLTDDGWGKLAEASAGHIGLVNEIFVNRLSAAQFEQLTAIGAALAEGLDTKGRVLARALHSRNERPGLSRDPAELRAGLNP